MCETQKGKTPVKKKGKNPVKKQAELQANGWPLECKLVDCSVHHPLAVCRADRPDICMRC